MKDIHDDVNERPAAERTSTSTAEWWAADTGDLPVRTVAKRAVLSFALLTGILAALGWIGRWLIFDRAPGDAEADFVAWIAEHRVGFLDSAASIASTLSDTWTVIGVLIGAVSMLWVVGHRRHASTVVLAVLLEFTTFLAVGELTGRARPDVDALNSVPSTPSYPSGHTAAAFVLYGALVLVARSLSPQTVPRWIWAIPLAIALLVAASRVYEGVHHPTDVLAGLLLGAGALAAASYTTGITVRRDSLE